MRTYSFVKWSAEVSCVLVGKSASAFNEMVLIWREPGDMY